MLRIVMAQLNFFVGDIDGNTQQVADAARQAVAQHNADILLCPELTLTGYPPEDLLLRPSIKLRVDAAIKYLKEVSQQLPALHMVFGYPKLQQGKLYNVAGVLLGGELVLEYAKQDLPNYQVFDEKRYFSSGDKAGIFSIGDISIGLTVCEDVWGPRPIKQAAENGAQLILNLNASPFNMQKHEQRLHVLKQRAQESDVAIVYVNHVGGQDELVFDGGALLMNPGGEKAGVAPYFEQDLYVAEYDPDTRKLAAVSKAFHQPALSDEARLYQALVLGVRDYVNKNGFKGVVLGLSGGIDSALTLAIAADAIGPERVRAVMMPFEYTAAMSIEDAEQEALALNVTYDVLPIHKAYHAFVDSLEPIFAGRDADTTEENIQARCRGVMLMAISNKTGYMVLTTGNKSEMAVGYTTLYGDMVGGFSALKDVFKTWVYRLSRYRNTLSPVIPERVIERAPSAELAPDQVDQDSLPPYEQLDEILSLYIEKDWSAYDIIGRGFDKSVVERIIRLVDLNEYKRRQAPVGVRVTEKGFGRDRRYPITSGWKAGL